MREMGTYSDELNLTFKSTMALVEGSFSAQLSVGFGGKRGRLKGYQ